MDDDEEDENSPNISMSSLNSSFRSFPSSRSNSPPPTKKFKMDDSMQPNYDRCKICKNIVGKYLSSIINEPMRRNPISHDHFFLQMNPRQDLMKKNSNLIMQIPLKRKGMQHVMKEFLSWQVKIEKLKMCAFKK